MAKKLLLVVAGILMTTTAGCEVYGPAFGIAPGVVVAPAPVAVGFFPYGYGHYGYYGWHRGYWR